LKKWLYGMMITAIVLSFHQNEANAASKEIKVSINGVQMEFPDGKPFINTDNRTMVPIRFISENLGYKVKWNHESKEAVIENSGKKLSLKANSKNMNVNGENKTIDTVMNLVEGRTYVPISFISSAMGEKVRYDHEAKEVKLTKTEEPKELVGEAVIHTVQPGDSLWALSVRYGVSVDQIKEWNSLTSDMLYVGQELKVSDGPIPVPAAPAFLEDAIFPMKKGTYSPFGDTWGAARSGGRTHEGTDIIAKKGVEIFSATDGVIANYGWNTLGGWRITIRTNDGYHLYYAHLSKYAENLAIGTQVKKGQLIGYVGDSGEGPEGTIGKFVSHLHFGMYDPSWNAVNPYQHLKYWESKN